MGIGRMIERAGEAAGLPFPLHVHMLRHSTGYALAARGMDTRRLQHFLGHASSAGFNSPGSATDTFGSTFGTTTNTSFLGGGQLGVNYEFWSFFVIGAEAMFDWLPNTQNTVNVTNTTITPGTTNTAAVTLNNRWVTMATGKLGYAWDRLLLYGKGGGAWVGASSPGLTVNNLPASISNNNN